MTTGKAAKAPPSGWGPVPHALLRLQGALGLTNNEVSLVLHVCSYQRSLADRPFPNNKAIASAMRTSLASIKRWKQALVSKGYLVCETKRRYDGSNETSYWDFTPLWLKLRDLTPGTQLVLFPNREGDGGGGQNQRRSNGSTACKSSDLAGPEVVESEAMKLTTDYPSAHGRAEDRLTGDTTLGSRVSRDEEEAVEEEPTEEENSYGSAIEPERDAAPPAASDPKETELLETKLQVPPELQVSPEVIAKIEYIRPEGDPVDEKKLRNIEEAAKARTKAVHEAQTKKRLEKRRLQENLEGKPKPKLGKYIYALEKVWREEMQTAFPSLFIGKWAGPEVGQAKALLEAYDAKFEVIRDAVQYLIRNWKAHNTKIFKGSASYPTVGMLLKLHQKFVLEAQQWTKVRDVIAEYDEFWAKNPDASKTPAELKARYAEADTTLKALGLK